MEWTFSNRERYRENERKKNKKLFFPLHNPFNLISMGTRYKPYAKQDKHISFNNLTTTHIYPHISTYVQGIDSYCSNKIPEKKRTRIWARKYPLEGIQEKKKRNWIVNVLCVSSTQDSQNVFRFRWSDKIYLIFLIR